MKFGCLLLVVVGCGVAQGPALDAEQQLTGAWTTEVDHRNRPLPCAFVIDFLADGSAETNYLNDDSEAKACSFARLAVHHEPTATPPRVTFGKSATRACIYSKEGGRLRIACDEHGEAPTSFESSMVLRRLEAAQTTGLKALIGTWQWPQHWGPSPPLEINRKGETEMLGEKVAVVVRGSAELDIVAKKGTLRCLYEHRGQRLTLRCADRGQSRPTRIFAGTLDTLVLTRQRGPGLARQGNKRAGTRRLRRGRDRDGDGVKNDVDQCPDEPEDYDGFADSDGCPDPDNDSDGLLDRDDECPQVAEDRDGDEDEDGCPEGSRTDRDGDGIVDSLDKCPDDPEDRDAFQDRDGCPDPDNDQDGILDVDDLCPGSAEDRDAFDDEDGCPDPDNDRDRILDPRDRCPNEAEVYNGRKDSDGCPD